MLRRRGTGPGPFTTPASARTLPGPGLDAGNRKWHTFFMPMPYAYRHAQAEWRAVLDAALDGMGLSSDNAAYTAVQGVLLAFRQRLTVDQALRFADLLPAVPRAIFVEGWHPQPPVPFGTRPQWEAEARALRPHHNLTPPGCVAATARALRPLMEDDRLMALLATFPDGAVAFWSVPDPQPVRRFP